MTPFFDRNFGSRVPRAIRLAGQEIRLHDEECRQDTPDTEIIPLTAQNDWVLVTRDKKLRKRPAEVEAIRSAAAKCVVLAQRAQMNAWDLLQRVVCSWSDIEQIVDNSPGPFILNVYKDGRLSRIDL